MDKHQVRTWETDEVTLHFKRLIKDALEFKTQELAHGVYLDQSSIAEKYSYAVGFLEGLRFVLSAELLPEEDNTDESTPSPDS